MAGLDRYRAHLVDGLELVHEVVSFVANGIQSIGHVLGKMSLSQQLLRHGRGVGPFARRVMLAPPSASGVCSSPSTWHRRSRSEWTMSSLYAYRLWTRSRYFSPAMAMSYGEILGLSVAVTKPA